MPELPEVETMKRGLRPIVGHRIVGLDRPRSRHKPIEIAPALALFRRRVQGRTIAGLDRVGKRVVVQLDSHDRIVLEPRMTGLVLLAEPPTREHLRLCIHLEPPSASVDPAGELLFWDRRGLGSVRLLAPPEFERRYGLDRLGPDALEIDGPMLRARLGESRRAVKVALLDQRAVAGIGNLYASEILHLAGINPRRACRGLKTRDWTRVHEAIGEVLRAAILCEGSTLSDGTYRNALSQSGGYQNHHRVYDRAGESCPRCGGAIERIVQAQRSTFFCPGCQRR
jgi:formamidopyrimidine-DNA glycosylase